MGDLDVKGMLAGAGVLACALAGLAGPVTGQGAYAARTAAPAALPVNPVNPITPITVNGNGGDRVYDGTGAILGGGGNARYLMDYPARQRAQILDYLFKPGYGASLQILKLEIGGDANSTDGSEPSVEHTRGHIRCQAGYEFAIARRALARNRHLLLYGLQWTAPGWVKDRSGTHFTSRDITYLLDWLGCARRQGLTVGYLGGWNETDTGVHHGWFRRLRRALNDHGDRRVQIVGSDSNGRDAWHYVGDPSIAILGAHNVCGTPTGVAGPETRCNSPWSRNGRKQASRQPMWGSELGGMDANAGPQCQAPCAPAMDRAVVRGYVNARLTGFIEWPVLDAMPPGLPFENRGLVTADQPWSGRYRVNAMTWAVAQVTQFAWPRTPGSKVAWRYLSGGSGLLRRRAADGAYVSLVRTTDPGTRGHQGRGRGSEWTTIIEATTARTVQRAAFHVTGGQHLARRAVHVWASDFAPRQRGPQFTRRPDIHPSRSGRFTLTVRPGWVYSLSTAGGQGRGHARGRPARRFPLPLTESLGGAGRAAGADDEPPYLAAQDGAFELAPCRVRDRGDRTCTEQKAAPTPVFWRDAGARPGTHFPYATIGNQTWANYKVTADVLLTRRGTTAGLIGRFSCRMNVPDVGQFDGYVFDVSSTGAWKLIRNANPATDRTATCAQGPGQPQTLGSGQLARPLGTGRWHRLALSMSGARITGSVDGRAVTTAQDSSWTSGQAGLEAGAFTSSWPRAQYSHLAVTRLGR